MRFVYSFIMYLLTPYLLLRLWWKGRRLPAYRERVSERFCWDKKEKESFDAWIHTVSLGEVIAAIPLIDELLKKNRRLLVTTMTPTGAERVKNRFGEQVVHRYIPYDLPSALHRFFQRNKAKIGVILETELWPNLVAKATAFKIPLLLVNGRLSERSCHGYKKIKWLIEPVLKQFRAILTQTPDDAARFERLGADKKQVHVFGNVKFDLQTQNIPSDLFSELKKKWGETRPVFMVASTHEDEEKQILSALNSLKSAIPDVILLIAPRHPERFQKVFHLAQQLGFNTGLRTEAEQLNENLDVVILDSMGELLGFYQISDYAFVGGSFVPIGGHNVLEPIAMGVPVLTGKHMHNFKAISDALTQAKGMETVDNAEDLMQKIKQLHQDAGRRRQLIHNATAVFKENQGAVARYVNEIESILNEG